MDYYKFTPEDREEWITRTTPVTKVKASISRTDTCYFAINTLGVTPLSWQLKLWNMIDKGKKRIAICTPRQVGKSIGVAIFALKAATMNIAPAGVNKKTMVGIVSATEEQSKKLMAEIKRLIVLGDEKVSRATLGKNKTFYSDKIDNRQIATNNKSTITFTNGNQIVCLPPTNRVRGYSFSYMFVDEAAFIDDPEIYYDSIEPTVSQTNGAIILTSTPNGQQGFFYDIFDPYEKYEHHDYSRLWIHYSELNKEVEIEKNLIDGIMLKKQNYYARGLVKHFEQEYEAKFNVQVSAFFEADHVDKLFKCSLLKEARYTGECDCAVDFGMVNSHSVITVTHINEAGVIERLYHYQYPFGEDDQLISDLEEIRERFNVQRFIPDDCAQGYHTIQKMIEKGWNVQPMSFKKDKVKKYTEFRAWLNRGKVKSYNDSVLSEEMKALQEEESKLSTLIHKPRGGTDDMIDSFVMSCYFYLEVDSNQFQTYDLNDY